MNTELYKDILNSKIIKIYSFFQKTFEYTAFIKWFMFICFPIGGIALMINDTPPLWAKIIMGLVFIPSVIYALTGGIIHYLAGYKIRQWCKKYSVTFDFVLIQIEKIYNEK